MNAFQCLKSCNSYLPIWTWMNFFHSARGRLVRLVGCSHRQIISPTYKLRAGTFHCLNLCNWDIYSFIVVTSAALLPDIDTITVLNNMGLLLCWGSHIVSVRWPIKNLPGIKNYIASVGSETSFRGLELRHASIRITTVLSSSNVSPV